MLTGLVPCDPIDLDKLEPAIRLDPEDGDLFEAGSVASR